MESARTMDAVKAMLSASAQSGTARVLTMGGEIRTQAKGLQGRQSMLRRSLTPENKKMKRLLVALFTLLLASVAAHAAPDAAKPNVRTITAFVRLDRASYLEQIDAAMVVLNAAKAEFARRGYHTQTVRIVTQPLAELVQGLNEAE